MITAQTFPFILVLVVVALVGMTAFSLLRPRQFRNRKPWLPPAFMALGMGAFFSTRPVPSLLHFEGLLLAFAIGLLFGWIRGRLVDITIEPDTGLATQRGTTLGFAFLVALLVLRQGARVAALRHPELGLDANAVTEILLPLALGMLSGYPLALNAAYRRALANHGGRRPRIDAAR